MRTLSTAFKNAITAQTVRPVFLLELELNSGTLRYSTTHFDVSYDGHTWAGGSIFLSPSQFTLTNDLTIDGITIGLAGASSTMVSLVLSQLNQYDPMKYYFGVLDTDDTVLDAHLLFDGYIDSTSIDDEGNFSQIYIDGETDLALIMDALDWKYNQQTQQRFDATDIGFEYMEQMQNWTGTWMKVKRDKRVDSEPDATPTTNSKKKRRNRKKKRKRRRK